MQMSTQAYSWHMVLQAIMQVAVGTADALAQITSTSTSIYFPSCAPRLTTLAALYR